MATLSSIITPTNVVAVAPGASGNVLTSNGTTWQSTALQAGITNVVTATSSTTLTSTPTLLKFAPTRNDQTITLPNATTMNKGANVFVIDVSGGYQGIIVDNGGNILAWTPRNSGSEVVIHLIDNTTSNGVWGFDGVEYWGLEADQEVTFTSKINTSASIYTSAIEVDANKTLILASSNNLQAVVYDKSTNTFGSAVLVRNAATISNFYVGVISSTAALVVSAASTNDLEGVVLSISGTTITVNTAGTYTLTGGGHLSNLGYRNLVAFGTSWLYLCNSASAGAVMPIDVTGTTVTFGTPVATTGLQIGAIYAVTSSVALVTSQNASSTIYAECFTVSGSTATKNSNISIASTVNNYFIEQIGSRWAIVAQNGTTATGDIISVAGTVPSNSSVTLITGSSTLSGAARAYHKIGNQLICTAYLANKGYFNVLTDNAGTAVAGTQVLVGVGSSAQLYYTGGNATEGWWRNTTGNGEHYGIKVTISGNDPVVTTLWRSAYSSTTISAPTASTRLNGTPFSDATLMWSNARAINPQASMSYSPYMVAVENGMIAFEQTSIVQSTGLNRMLNDSAVWVVVPIENSATAAGTSTKYRVQKARVV